MPERQQHRAGNSKPRGRLQIDTHRQDMRTARVMMVVLHRTAVTLTVISLRSLTHFMIPTAGFGDFAALAGGIAAHGKDAGIQAREDAEKQQCREKESHQWPQNRRHSPEIQGKIRIARSAIPRLAGGVCGS